MKPFLTNLTRPLRRLRGRGAFALLAVSALALGGASPSVSAQETAAKVASSNATIQDDGDSGQPWFHNAQVPGSFESFAISSYSFSPGDFGFSSVEGISGMKISFMQSNAGFTADGPVELFISFDTTVAGGDYGGLSHSGSGAGLDDSQFLDSPSTQSLGTGTFTETSDGDVDTYTLTISGALETSLVNAINNGEPFSIILGAPSGDTVATYAGLENNDFEINGGEESDSKRTTLSITATSDSSGGPVDPLVGDVSVSDVMAGEATVTASFFLNDGEDFTEYGFLISRTDVEPDPTLDASGVTTVDFDYLLEPPDNPFAAILEGLDAETEYAVRSYLVFDNGDSAVESASVTTFTTAALPPALDGVTDYTEDFSGFDSDATLPAGWTVDADGSASNRLDFSEWASTATGIKFSSDSVDVLGYQHSSGTGVAAKTLTLINDTGGVLDEITVSYVGRVARADQGRSPAYMIEVNGTEVPTLAYSTADGDSVSRSATAVDLGIAPGESFEITWTSDRGESSGASKQIGISDVVVSVGASTVPPTVTTPQVSLDFDEEPLLGRDLIGVDATIVSDGGSDLIERGFVLAPSSVETAPTVDTDGATVIIFDEAFVIPDAEEFFFADFTDLDAGTEYSVRAFATNSEGTSYSGTLATSTLPPAITLDDSGSYTEDFNGFDGTLPIGWTAASTEGVNSFGGDWGGGSAGGFRGPEEGASDGVLGYQHTSGTGELEVTAYFVNESSDPITELDVGYLGRVERVEEGRSPIWTVAVDGTEVPELSYSTEEGVDKEVSATVVGLDIDPGEEFTITWTSDRGEPGGSSKQIGLADVSVEIRESSGVAAPIPSVATGTYFDDQTVFVDNAADYGEDVELFYTLDGSTPTSSSSLYDDATGIPLEDGSGAVELNVVAINSDMEEESIVVTRTYTFPVNVDDIAALRAASTGGLYRVTGEITYTGGTEFRNTKFFQDASGSGIQIDDDGGVISTTYEAGDNIEGFVGTLGSFQNQLQWVPAFDPGAPVTSDNPVTPVVRTLDTLSADDQALLVRINDVEFEDAGDLFEGGGSQTGITDPSVSGFEGIFRNNFGESDITDAEIPSGTVDVIGVIQQRNDDFSISARSLDDIIEDSDPSGNPFDEYLDGFDGLDPADRAPGADPANDGVPNAAKFVYGGSPLVADRGMLPTGETVEEGGDNYFELTLEFARAATWDAETATFTGDGFTVLVESSLDLIGFDPADMVARSGVTGGEVAADSTVVLRSAAPIGDAGFYRTVVDVDTGE